ncbi:MAG: hypothetical protein H6585_00780 [Flavobacteriales bacterium]|nr:hypothetical protein [Flavobacteriales bacterium]MCB9446861.1 hypothetical protein [Flavobacteriales bacterium]
MLLLLLLLYPTFAPMLIKRICGVALLSVFLFQTFSRLVIMVDFYLNQDYLEQAFCVNKDKPQMHCHGKCHMKNMLKKEEKKETSPASPFKEKREIQLFSQRNEPNHFADINRVGKTFTPYRPTHSHPHTRAVFHPPAA